jgi:hypothetical protein
LWRLQSGREPGELEEGKLKVVRIGIHGGKKQERSEAHSCSSAAARSHTFLLARLRAPTAPSMPDVVDGMLDYAVWCFPHASPALTTGAGKRQTGPRDRSKSLIRLRKIGAGEGIRTLDPNLGKVLINLSGVIQFYPTTLHTTDSFKLHETPGRPVSAEYSR